MVNVSYLTLLTGNEMLSSSAVALVSQICYLLRKQLIYQVRFILKDMGREKYGQLVHNNLNSSLHF